MLVAHQALSRVLIMLCYHGCSQISFPLCESLHVHSDNTILQKNNQNIALASVCILAVFLHITHVAESTAEMLKHTKFCSHSPRNCWNFWDIRSWALPTALRTFPSTAERMEIDKHTWQHTWLDEFFHGCTSWSHPVICAMNDKIPFFAIVGTQGTQQDTIRGRATISVSHLAQFLLNANQKLNAGVFNIWKGVGCSAFLNQLHRVAWRGLCWTMLSSLKASKLI